MLIIFYAKLLVVTLYFLTVHTPQKSVI